MIGENTAGGEIALTTAFAPACGCRCRAANARVSLPLEFCVRDNGPGVPDELMPHLFDPFVTTKPSGSGLGLALVAKIVGDHGGIIECESQPRRTTFRVFSCRNIPRYGAARPPSRTASCSHKGSIDARGSILVADDDAAIRTVLNQALSRAGYEVRSTGNAATLVAVDQPGRRRSDHHRRGVARRERFRLVAAHQKGAARICRSSS